MKKYKMITKDQIKEGDSIQYCGFYILDMKLLTEKGLEPHYFFVECEEEENDYEPTQDTEMKKDDLEYYEIFDKMVEGGGLFICPKCFKKGMFYLPEHTESYSIFESHQCTECGMISNREDIIEAHNIWLGENGLGKE